MSADILPFVRPTPKTRYLERLVLCHQCLYSFMAMIPEAADRSRLECPACGGFKGQSWVPEGNPDKPPEGA